MPHVGTRLENTRRYHSALSCDAGRAAVHRCGAIPLSCLPITCRSYHAPNGQVETHTLWFATKKTILDVREMRLDPKYRASHKWDSSPTGPGREPLCEHAHGVCGHTHHTRPRAGLRLPCTYSCLVCLAGIGKRCARMRLRSNCCDKQPRESIGAGLPGCAQVLGICTSVNAPWCSPSVRAAVACSA
jgi:hypothetical protein